MECEEEGCGVEKPSADESFKPYVGMEFDSVEEADSFDKNYARRMGFGVLRRSLHKKDGLIYHYVFACNKYKKVKERDCAMPAVPEKNRPVFAGKCKASIGITDHGFVNRWEISKVHLEHNHELTPDSSFLITIPRDIPLRYQKQLESNEDKGIPASININIVISDAGGYGECPFTHRDARNHIDKFRREKLKHVKGGDPEVLMQYFEKKATFWFCYKIDVAPTRPELF